MFFFFSNDTATTEIYTLSLHDALPIYRWSGRALTPLEAFQWPEAVDDGGRELLERVRRVDDGEVLEVAASSAAVCAFARG